jgi:hypothetical protein
MSEAFTEERTQSIASTESFRIVGTASMPSARQNPTSREKSLAAIFMLFPKTNYEAIFLL